MAPSERGLPRSSRLGESAVVKRYKVVNLARRGLLPSRSRVPPSSRREASPLRRAPRATSPEVRGNYGGSKPPPYDIEFSHFVIDETSLCRKTKLHFPRSGKLHFVARRNFPRRSAPQRHIRRIRNFTFRRAENFTFRRTAPRQTVKFGIRIT